MKFSEYHFAMGQTIAILIGLVFVSLSPACVGKKEITAEKIEHIVNQSIEIISNEIEYPDSLMVYARRIDDYSVYGGVLYESSQLSFFPTMISIGTHFMFIHLNFGLINGPYDPKRYVTVADATFGRSTVVIDVEKCSIIYIAFQHSDCTIPDSTDSWLYSDIQYLWENSDKQEVSSFLKKIEKEFPSTYGKYCNELKLNRLSCERYINYISEIKNSE